MRWLSKNENFSPCITTNMSISWRAIGPNTIALKESVTCPTHIILKWKNGKRYYCGYLESVSKISMLLKDFKKPDDEIEVKKERFMSVSVLNEKILKRCMYQSDPRVMSLENEKIARWVIYNLVDNKEIWFELEKQRIEMLKEHFDISNIKLIYPEIKSLDTAVNDVHYFYKNSPIKMNISHIKVIFSWLDSFMETI